MLGQFSEENRAYRKGAGLGGGGGIVVVMVVVVVTFSSFARILGECSTSHSSPAFFCFVFF